MAAPFEPLRLKDERPFATGAMKMVFHHPHDKRLLVKVIKPSVVERRRVMERNWFKRRRRLQAHIDFVREITQYVSVKSNTNRPILSIQRFVGIVDTDLGLGMVVEKVTGRDGEPAPRLVSLLRRDGFTPEIKNMLEVLIEDLNRNHVVLNELRARNIVYAENESHERRLVLIDGIGEKVLIPLFSFSKFANTRMNMRKYRRLVAEAKRIAAG
jgi:hypothetical protein